MAYQALYRQWRPQNFSQMVGQEAIIETLRHQVQSRRIAHAYLFCGSRGTGKTSTAKILARAINCLNPQNGDPCGVCEICEKMRSEEYMDILEFDAASNSKVEDARDLLEKAVFPPQLGAYKVYIIDEVHMLSNSAFNALLKTLEEPPEYLVFILATTEPYKLPATILSRCQRFDFGRIPASQICGRLHEAAAQAGCEASPGALMAIARAAEGGMRDALSILDMCIGYDRPINEELVRNVLGTSDRSFLFSFSLALQEEDAGKVLRLIDQLMNQGKDPLIFSRDLCGHLRNLILAKTCGKELYEILGLTEEEGQDYLREGNNYQISRLMDMLDLFMKLDAELKYTASPRIALENVSLKCCLRTKESDQLALNDRISELENQISQLREALSAGIALAPAARHEAVPVVSGEKKAAAPKSERKKAAAAANPSQPEELSAESVWKSAMKELQKNEPGVHGMLLMGQFCGSSGDEFRWKANPGFDVIIQSLNIPAKKQVIENALAKVSGRKISFQIFDGSQDLQQKENASDESYLKELYDTFGEEPIDVVDELPE